MVACEPICAIDTDETATSEKAEEVVMMPASHHCLCGKTI
ncbi:hypothetical protein [uncultured Mobiluncus sp.]|nr:hypothetical protein [uncultured Mobiluncus sp.]